MNNTTTATAPFVRKPTTLAVVQDALRNIKNLEKRLGTKITGTPYYIAQEKHLTAAEWEAFTGDLLADRDWIAKFSAHNRLMPMQHEMACIRVTGEGSTVALLVDPAGYTYARYVAIEGQ